MGAIDILVIVVLGMSMVFASYRGLARELLGIVAWIFAGFGALYSYSYVQPWMGKFIDNPTLAGIAGAGLVGLILLIAMTIMNAHVAGHLRRSSLSGLDRVLGFFFGVVRGAFLIGIAYIGASMLLSDAQLNALESENKTIPHIQTVVAGLNRLIPENIKEDMQEYEQGKLAGERMKKIGVNLKKSLPEEVIQYREADKEKLDTLIEEITED
ncbi:MAG: CvpA family protein [Alphaproteobacteria bacterium]|nr:CvpA family protein [Alphaproteobacteria bacterium]